MSNTVYCAITEKSVSLHSKKDISYSELTRDSIIRGILSADDHQDEKMSKLLTALYTKLLREEDAVDARVDKIKVPTATAVYVKNYVQNRFSKEFLSHE